MSSFASGDVPPLSCLPCAVCCCRRDEALFAIQGSIAVQQQQELSISAEMAGFRNDVLREQVGGADRSDTRV